MLVGHSYGGLVIGAVAEKVPERIRRLVYLDAYIPYLDNITCNIRIPFNTTSNVSGGIERAS